LFAWYLDGTRDLAVLGGTEVACLVFFLLLLLSLDLLLLLLLLLLLFE